MYYKNIKILILLFLFFSIPALFSACQSILSIPTKGVISGIVADLQAGYSECTKEDTIKKPENYKPVHNALVTIEDNYGAPHHAHTDIAGYYQFESISVKACTIIEMVKETTDGVKIYKDLIPLNISSQESYYVGVTGALETARILVLEALIRSGEEVEQLVLEDISNNKYFTRLVNLVGQAQRAGEEFTNNYLIQEQIELITKSILFPSNIPPTNVPTTPPSLSLSSAKDILSYQFRIEDNTCFSYDVIGTIDEEDCLIKLVVPYNADIKNLIAAFEISTSAKAYIGEIIQKSGITVNDFTIPVTYTIVAEDGSKQEWQIIVEKEIGPLHHFTISGYPELTIAGEYFGNSDITITACDMNDKIKYDYLGEVYFMSTDSNTKVIFPCNDKNKYSFTEEDQGSHCFPGDSFKLITAGEQIITITDGLISAESKPVNVLAAELSRFEFNKINDQVVEIPFNITIIALDSFGNIVTEYMGINILKPDIKRFGPHITENFVNGIWSGEITFLGPQTHFQFKTVCSDNEKITGFSNIFDILYPAPSI